MTHPILTAAEMRLCDEYTIHTLGIPSRTLMERAAHSVVQYMTNDPRFGDGEVLVLCSSGNNGGDGFAAARFLAETRPVTVCYVGKTTSDSTPDVSRMSEECHRQYELAVNAGVSVLLPPDVALPLGRCTAVVDAIFGIGLCREVAGETASLFDMINASDTPVLAVDIPSGISADTGEMLGVALRATATVTMQALKAGLLLRDGIDCCGEITIADIGIDLSQVTLTRALADESLVRRAMPPRSRRSHKGSYGTLLCVCGSPHMSGAACLAAKAAVRAGVGLTHILTSPDNRLTLQGYIPEAITHIRNEDDSVEELIARISPTAAVIGCGLDTTDDSLSLLRTILNSLPQNIPTVLDADALNLLSHNQSLWHTALLASSDKQVILTPHPREMSRLCGLPVTDILRDPLSVACDYAKAHGVTVALKDAHTVIASPDGGVFICAAGNAGMAKGGSGDVLAGIIGSLLAQCHGRMSTTEIAAAGVVLHAMAGDTAASLYGEYAMTPSDMIDALATVTRTLSDSRTPIYGAAFANNGEV